MRHGLDLWSRLVDLIVSYSLLVLRIFHLFIQLE